MSVRVRAQMSASEFATKYFVSTIFLKQQNQTKCVLGELRTDYRQRKILTNNIHSSVNADRTFSPVSQFHPYHADVNLN